MVIATGAKLPNAITARHCPNWVTANGETLPERIHEEPTGPQTVYNIIDKPTCLHPVVQQYRKAQEAPTNVAAAHSGRGPSMRRTTRDQLDTAQRQPEPPVCLHTGQRHQEEAHPAPNSTERLRRHQPVSPPFTEDVARVWRGPRGTNRTLHNVNQEPPTCLHMGLQHQGGAHPPRNYWPDKML